jgi:hypothetical protein
LPAALLTHLAVWIVLLLFYPRSPRLQSVVFWNPMLRKILGLGYIDLVLLYVPFARRQLFLPFRAAFLGDIGDVSEEQLDRIDYFRESSVTHRWRTFARKNQDLSFQQAAEPIVQALSRHRGRVLLLGKSGLGKSSFLRYWLAQRAGTGRDVIVYLRADECRESVEFRIEERMHLLGRDQNLLRAMIYAGRIYVYIDGYNEVDIKTQDVITGFLANYPHANILVASQITMRGLTTIDSYELQPLDRQQIRAFLASRKAVLAPSAPVRDDAFVKSADAFLDDLWSRTGDQVNAFDEILSNPMDLTSVALLIGDASVPDVFALEAQQFASIQRRMAVNGATFRTAAFSVALMKQRITDQENLEALPFNPEVAELVRAKMALVRTYTDPSGRVASQEVRFRHDRIRDYFTHFAFIAMSSEERAQHAQDARFAGVYPFLARALAPHDAEDLRERLIRIAAEIEDHRISDSFVREYSWRQRLASRDPDWMLSYDLPDARAVEGRFEALTRDRERVEAAMNEARARLVAARRLTRVLTTADSAELLVIAADLCIALGARADEGAAVASHRALRTPRGTLFFLAALGQLEAIRSFHLDLLLVRLAPLQGPTVLVTNARVSTDPLARPPDLDEASLSRAASEGLIVVSGQEIYSAYASGADTGAAALLWERIEHHGHAGGSAPAVPT